MKTKTYYMVEALETFIHRTHYAVEAGTGPNCAASREEAEALCKAGSIPYDSSEVEEGDETWLETVSVELSD